MLYSVSLYVLCGPVVQWCTVVYASLLEQSMTVCTVATGVATLQSDLLAIDMSGRSITS